MSRLFRQETGRRLRASADRILETYIEERYAWLDAYGKFSPDEIRRAVFAIADAVARDDATWYHTYASEQVRMLMADGMPPIAVIAAADILNSRIMRVLTSDQWNVVAPILESYRAQLRAVLYEEMVARSTAKGA